ncbi:MAG TPA: hypothetical protein VLJ57_07855 [Burkholderiaceae bacterium]|nr:hypothetical protein [Burkholderiaceae bacterium]
MRCFLTAAVLALVLLAGCNPVFNWREARFDAADLTALLPCKPDKAERPVLLGTQQVTLQMQGCDTGGATFAVARVALSDAGQAGQALAQWKAATLANMRAATVQEAAFVPPGAIALPQSLRVAASGYRPDGRAVSAHAAWFARTRGNQIDLFHIALYADRVDPEVSSTFFSGIRFP